MKKTLLFLAITALCSISTMNAQTKVWNFSDTSVWPLSAGIEGSTPIIVDNLGLYPPSTTGTTNFAAVIANVTTFSDGFVSVNRLQVNGGGSAGSTFMPTQRYFFIDVDGACTLQMWVKSGSDSAARNVFVTNGTALTDKVVCTIGITTAGKADNVIGSVSLPSAGRYYIYCDNSCNFYKMSVTGANVTTSSITLGTSNATAKQGVGIYAVDHKVVVSGSEANAQVRIYTANGSLVKSEVINSNAEFALNPGLYIVNVKSAKGEKSQKVLVK